MAVVLTSEVGAILNRLVDLDEIFMGVMALNITSTTYYLIP
jgi:hypothetical protein